MTRWNKIERWNWGRRTLLYLAAAGSVDYIFRDCPNWLQAVGWGILIGAYFYDSIESGRDEK